VEFTPVEVTGERSDILRKVAGIFGLRIVFYTSDGATNKTDISTGRGASEGFFLPRQKNTIFLNAGSNKHLTFILGHEVSHAMEINNISAYQEMLDKILPLLDPRNMQSLDDS